MLLNLEDKKNILIITHAAGNSVIGPNNRWAKFSQGLLKNKIRLTIIGASFFHKYRSIINCALLNPNISYTDKAKFIHIWTPSYRNSFFRFLNQFIFSISLFFLRKKDFNNEKFKVVVASSPHPLIVLGSLYWAHRFQAKFVFESRDLWPSLLKEYKSMSSINPYILLTQFMERIAVKNSSFILTPKQFEKKYYKSAYNYNKVFWIPNTCRKNNLISCKSKINKFGLSIVYSGSLQSIYLIDEIILAMRLIKNENITLNILGDGPELKKLKTLSKDDKRIKFKRWVSGDDYWRILENSDIGYFSTIDMKINKYGFSSNKISDYLSRGKPILAHVSNGVHNLLESNCALQSRPGDKKGLALNIKKFANQHALLNKMGVSAKKYYSKFYDYDTVIKNLVNTINNTI